MEGVSEWALIIRTSEGDLLFLLDANGFKPFLKDVPRLWVTAPTGEKADLDFLINGNFDLEVGRSQLANNSDKNLEQARNIGSDVSDILSEMYDASENDWKQFCRDIHIAESTEAYDFWHSLFNVMTHNLNKENNTVTLAKEILWNNSGYLNFITHKESLPNGLWGEYKALTSLGKTEFRIKGSLDREDIFIEASKLQSFRQKADPEQVISEKVIDKLPISKSEINELTSFKDLNLPLILDWELADSPHINAEKAELFGKIFSKEFLTQIQYGSNDEKEEFRQFNDLFKDMKFFNKNGNWKPASELIISSDELDKDRKDELLRAAFAPDERILAETYKGESIKFIVLCRQRLQSTTEMMAEWAKSLDDENRQKGVFEYLLHGELRLDFGKHLSEKIDRGSWLWDIHEQWLESFLLRNYSDEDKKEILRILNIGITYREAQSPSTSGTPKKPDETLNDVYLWWQKNKKLICQNMRKKSIPM